MMRDNFWTLLLGVGAVLGLAPPLIAGEYTLASGDVIEISVFGSPELQRRIAVNADGKIPYPFLGLVNVQGLTIGQVREELQESLVARGIMKTPDVTVDMAHTGRFTLAAMSLGLVLSPSNRASQCVKQ